MIRRLKDLLSGVSTPGGTETSRTDKLELAVAALLVEMARADYQRKGSEEEEIRSLLAQHFHLNQADTEDLLRQAKAAVDRSVSLRDFTYPLHQSLDYPEKQEVIRMLWMTALADRELDKYEDYLIGKLAELLYVSRGDVLRLKHQALQEIDPGTDH